MATLFERNSVWTDKHIYDEAEKNYYEKFAKGAYSTACAKKTSLAGEVAKARERIKQSLENVGDIKLPDPSSCNIDVQNKIQTVEKQVTSLRKDFENLRTAFSSLEKLVKDLDKKVSITPVQSGVCAKPAAASAACKKPEVAEQPSKDDDDDVDLFGSESEEDEEAQKIKEQRVAAYAAKKSKKPVLIAKSNIILDVKPWDDETDMKELENQVRNISMDGLVWGASKLVPLAYGIHKLQISCVVEDDKVSVDELQENIEKIEDYVQSVDIAAFNKV